MRSKNKTVALVICCLVLFLLFAIKVTPAQIEVSKPFLNFGVIKRPQAKSRQVVIKNASSSPFLGTLEVDKKWLTSETRDLSLATGASMEITFTVDSSSLAPGDYEAHAFFKDLMGAPRGEVLVNFTVVVGKDDPVLKIDTELVDFKEVEKGEQPVGSFFIENVGSGMLEGKVIYPEWINGKEEFKLHFTQKRPIYMRAFTLEFFPGEYTEEIKVESNGGQKTIEVKVKIKPHPDDPSIGFEPEVMDFGSVKKGKKGRKKLKIKNTGKGRLSGSISYPDWISGELEFKEIEKDQSLLFVADTGKLPYGLTKDIVKLTSEVGIVEVPVKIYVKRK